MRKEVEEIKGVEASSQKSEQGAGLNFEALPFADGDMGDLELSNIIDVAAVQQLLNHFYEFTHFPVSVIDVKGNVLAGVGWQDVCTRFHRVHPESLKNCLESDTQLTRGISPGEFKLYKCKNGMWDIATPIVIGGKHVGNLFSGQFFFQDEPLDYDLFRAHAKKYGFDEKEYIAGIDCVLRLSRETVDRGMAFLTRLAHMLSKLGYSNVKLTASLAQRSSLMDSLHESNARADAAEELAAIVQSSDDAIVSKTLDGIITGWNRAAEKIYGYTAEEAIGQSISILIPEDRQDEIPLVFQKISRSERNVNHDTTRMRKNGEEIHVSVCLAPIKNASGEVVGVSSIARDITERKRAERALHLSRAALQEETAHREVLLEIIPSPIFSKDLNGKYIGCNKAFEDFTGMPRGEIIGKTVYDMGPKEIADFYHQKDKELFDQPGKQSYEWQVRERNGDVRDVIFHKATIRGSDGRVTGIIGIITDITERKHAEQKLLNSEENFRSIFENSLDGILFTTPNGPIFAANRTACEILGRSEQEICRGGRSIFVDEDDPLLLKALEDRSKDGYFRGELNFKRKDGTTFPVELSSAVFELDNGGLRSCVVFRDITERKRAEDALRNANKRFDEIIDFLPDATFVIDTHGKVIAWNRAIEKMTGITKSDMLHKGDYEYAVPFFGERRPILIDIILKSEAEPFKAKYDFFHKRGDIAYSEFQAPLAFEGRGAYLFATASILRDSNGQETGAIESIRDITEKKALEDTLAKLAATDELTGLPNRREGMTRLEVLHKVSERKKRPYCVAMVDIDHFKNLNDQYGHANGDLVLKAFGDLAREALRSGDVCFRYGGEEFVILLPETVQEDGHKVVERLRQAWAATRVTLPDGRSVQATVSIGLTQYPNKNISVDHLIQASDRALYDAKNGGRNRTVCTRSDQSL